MHRTQLENRQQNSRKIREIKEISLVLLSISFVLFHSSLLDGSKLAISTEQLCGKWSFVAQSKIVDVMISIT